jgi:hypothetical protein
MVPRLALLAESEVCTAHGSPENPGDRVGRRKQVYLKLVLKNTEKTISYFYLQRFEDSKSFCGRKKKKRRESREIMGWESMHRVASSCRGVCFAFF